MHLFLGLFLRGTLVAQASTAPLVEPVDFAKLEAWVKENPTAKLEDALGALPETMRKGVVWVIDSDSAQKATAENPRGIVYSPGGKLTLAFSGVPDDPRRDRLEVLQFDEKTAKFVMREIDFGKRPPKVSAANPSACLRCHGNDPRPNWASYPIWPGTFGKQHHKDDATEHKTYGKFAAAKAKDPLYGKFFLEERAKFPEIDGENAKQRSKRLVEWRSHVLSDPNSDLSEFFGALNWARLARLMTATKLGNKIVPAVVALLHGCKPTSAMFPPEWAAFAAELDKATPGRRRENYQEELRYTVAVERVQMLVAALGESTKDWTMHFDRRDPLFSTPGDAAKELIGALRDTHPIVRSLFKPESEGESKYVAELWSARSRATVCDDLFKASVKELERVEPPKQLPKASATHR